MGRRNYSRSKSSPRPSAQFDPRRLTSVEDREVCRPKDTASAISTTYPSGEDTALARRSRPDEGEVTRVDPHTTSRPQRRTVRLANDSKA